MDSRDFHFTFFLCIIFALELWANSVWRPRGIPHGRWKQSDIDPVWHSRRGSIQKFKVRDHLQSGLQKSNPFHDFFSSSRIGSYTHADVFLVCFAVNHPESLKNVTTTWAPEVKDIIGDSTKIVLVGLKSGICNAYEQKNCWEVILLIIWTHY